ncbi:MAG: hypothetical protein IJA03_01765 [Bacteroidaceae bacterium]|nr:hypothetical protein [Bacteroidaceae bacterium]
MKLNKYINICNLYILIWMLYNFHWSDVGALFPVLDALSNVFLGINLLISAYCTIKVLARYPINSFFKGMNMLIVMFIIYGLISIVFGSDIPGLNKGSYLIGVLRTFLPIYTCFLFTKMGYLTEEAIRIWIPIFLIESIIIYMSFRVVLDVGELYELRTNNRGYLFVTLFPFVYFFRNRSWLQYVFVAILIFFSIQSVKRGAILIIALATICFFWHKLTSVSFLRKILVLMTLGIFVWIGSFFIGELYKESSVFQSRVEATMEGNTSSRDVIAKGLLDKYTNADTFNFLFGFGADGTVRTGVFAHNDWLEMLFNQGPLGLVVFFVFWLNWFRLWRRQAVKNTDMAFLLGLLFICNFPKTLFSMWYSAANIFVTLPLGYCLANIFVNDKKYIQESIT